MRNFFRRLFGRPQRMSVGEYRDWLVNTATEATLDEVIAATHVHVAPPPAGGPPTIVEKRIALLNAVSGLTPNATPPYQPVLPAPATGAPVVPAPRRQVDYGPLAWITMAALVVICIVVIAAALWPWVHDRFDNGSGTVVANNQTGGNAGSNNTSAGNGSSSTATATGNTAGTALKTNFKSLWTPPTPSANLDSMPKTTIELFQQGKWTHRVFNPRLFHAPDYGGADSWYVTLNVGPNSGGAWTSYGNPGEVIYRATSTQVSWCIAVLTTSQYKSKFLSNTNDLNQTVGFNVKTAPGTTVSVLTHKGETKSAQTSDLGDVLVQLPDDGVTTICTAFKSAAPTSESRLHWGPDDRPTEAINRIDAR